MHRVLTLGVVLAGGRSSRFGSDKAEALFEGRRLLDHALDALAVHCDEVAVVGRESGTVPSFPDFPGPGLGPLGGLAAALRYAERYGFGQVLSAPVDCIRLPRDLRRILEPAPACLESQPVIGLWPIGTFAWIERMFGQGEKPAIRILARHIDARLVVDGFAPPNINTQDDLEALSVRLDAGA